jgi:hypothetical protein
VRALWLGLAVFLASCAAHFTGELVVDGEPFRPSECRPGQAYGFRGVELVDTQGRRVRIAQEHEGAPATVYYPAHHSLGTCSSLRLASGLSKVQGVRSVEGDATLSCERGDRPIAGTIRFENCH